MAPFPPLHARVSAFYGIFIRLYPRSSSNLQILYLRFYYFINGFIYSYLCLFAYQSDYPSVYTVCLCCLSFCLFVWLSIICLSICLFVCLFVYLAICPFIYLVSSIWFLSICLFVCLPFSSICLFITLSHPAPLW